MNRSAVVNGRSSANVGVLSGAVEMVWLPAKVRKRPFAAALLQPPPPFEQDVCPGFGNCEMVRSRE